MSHDTNDSNAINRTTDAETNSITARHDWAQSEEPSVSLVEAVAVATDRTVTDLPQLQRSIDPDALDELLTRGESSSVSVSFRYADTTVWVNKEGSIEIQVDGDVVEEDD